jgi:V/A-type H+-transporting ATPase subunit G/H
MFIIQCVNREKGGDILALEAITQIKNVEAEADNIIKDATVKAKQILQQANEDAESQYEKAIVAAKEKCNSIIEKAIAEGQSKAEPILKQGEKDSQDIYNISTEKKMSAVKLVIERIVKVNGNS